MPAWAAVRMHVLDSAGVPLTRTRVSARVRQSRLDDDATRGRNDVVAGEPEVAVRDVEVDRAGQVVLRVKAATAGSFTLSPSLVGIGGARQPTATAWRIAGAFPPVAPYAIADLPDLRIPAPSLLASGVVQDALGQPVPRAQVFLAESGELEAAGVSDLAAETDQDGRFAIEGVAISDRVALAASKAGVGASEVVIANAGVRDVRLQLAAFGALAGQVLVRGDLALSTCGSRLWVTIEPEPLAGAAVWRHKGFSFEKERSVGSDGRFSLTAPAGSYVVCVTNGALVTLATIGGVLIHPDPAISDARLNPIVVDADLLECAQIAVRDHRGMPLARATVVAYMFDDRGACLMNNTAHTDAAGAVKFTVRKGTRVDVVVRKEGYSTSELSGVVPPVTVVLDEAHVVRVALKGTAVKSGASWGAVLIESPDVVGQPERILLPYSSPVGCLRQFARDGELVFAVDRAGAYDIVVSPRIGIRPGVLSPDAGLPADGICVGTVRVPAVQPEVRTTVVLSDAANRAIEQLRDG